MYPSLTLLPALLPCLLPSLVFCRSLFVSPRLFLIPRPSFPLTFLSCTPSLRALPPLYTRICSAFPAFPLFSPPPRSALLRPPPLPSFPFIPCIPCYPSSSPLLSPIATVGNAHALAAFVAAIPNTQTFVRFDDDGGDEKVLRPWDVYSPLGARLAFCVQTLTNVVARMKLRSDDTPGIAVDTVSRGKELRQWTPSAEVTFKLSTGTLSPSLPLSFSPSLLVSLYPSLPLPLF